LYLGCLPVFPFGRIYCFPHLPISVEILQSKLLVPSVVSCIPVFASSRFEIAYSPLGNDDGSLHEFSCTAIHPILCLPPLEDLSLLNGLFMIRSFVTFSPPSFFVVPLPFLSQLFRSPVFYAFAMDMCRLLENFFRGFYRYVALPPYFFFGVL